MDMMNEQEYCKKLQEVFEFLLSSSCHIHDDTLYHKLLDSLNGKMITPEFAESCGVIDFLQRAGNNTDISPDTLVFAVQLVEKLVSKLELPGIHLDTMSVLIETVALRTSVDNLSVFCALFTTLKTILQCPCLKEFCLNIDFQDILKKSFDILKEERSIFLSRAVSDFICSLFSSKMAESKEAKKLLKELQTIIVNFDRDGSQRVLSPSMLCSLRVLEKAPHLFNDSFAEILDVLILLMKTGSTQSSTTVARCLHSLCLQCQDRAKSERVKSLVTEAIETVDIVKGLHIAKVLYPLQLLERSSLENIILKPLQMLDKTNHSPAMHSSLPAVSLSLTIVNDCNIQKLEACKCVAEVLKMTENRHDDFTGSGCNSFTGSSKLQIKCLDYLGSYTSKEVMLSVISSISNIVSYTTEHMIYGKCLQCLCRLLPEVLCSSCYSSETSTVKSDLSKIKESVQRNFCSVEWEFRDTSCEFVRNLMDKHKDKEGVIQWMLDSRFHVFACQAVGDGESYVRATSLSTLQTVLLSSYRTNLLQDMNTTIDEIISQILDVCKTDSEAFPRRSAARLLHHCLLDLSYLLHPDSIQCIAQCFSTSLPSDFDWEVKLIVVEFWCAILKRCFDADLDKETSDQPLGIVVSLDCLKNEKDGKRGYVSISSAINVLLKLSCDYDPSVSERVCQELCWICETLEKFVLKINSATNDDNRSDWCMCAHCSQLITELLNRMTEGKEKTRNDSVFKTDYDSNALSLLDDILLLDRSHDNNDEDNAIDCY